MNKIIENIFSKAQSKERVDYETSLLDLRLLIERRTMDRYSNKELSDYLLLFHNADLISYRLNEKELVIIKYFLFYSLFNFPDRAVLIAKCIKVLFDQSLIEAICAAIKLYMVSDDDTTCELIFAITDSGDLTYMSNGQITDLFSEIIKIGGPHSQQAVKAQIDLFKEYFVPNDIVL